MEDLVEPLPRIASVDPRVGSSQERGAPPDPEMTRFESWFVEHYGTRPSAKTAGRLADDLSVAKQKVRQVEDLQDKVGVWDQRYDAALKAWMARETQDAG